MKALEKTHSETGLWMIDNAPVPEIGPDDVLIRIRKSAICGTDLHIYKWDEWASKTVPAPMIVGHEYVGIVEKTGRNVKNVKAGDRVSGEGHIVCGICRNCRAGKRHLCRNTLGVGVHRQGSFAQYLSLPASNVVVLPDSIPDDIAAMLDPLGNAVHTALAFDLAGEDVLITGAGPIGIMAAAVCRHAGARHVVITDLNPYRLSLAQEVGVTRAVHAGEQDLSQVMAEIDMTEGFDVGLEMSGHDGAINDMLSHMNTGGKIALLGIPPAHVTIDWNLIIFKGLELKGIYGRQMYETWHKMIAMLQSGLDVSKVITHHFPIDSFEQGFAVMSEGNCGKVILDW